MAIVKMKKVFIMSYKNWLNSITETLQQLGIMQITNIFKGSDVLSGDSPLQSHLSNNDEINLSVLVDENILELQYLLNFLPAQLSEKKSFIEDMMGNKNIVKQDILDKEVNLFDYKALFKECKEIETELSKLVNEKNSILKTLEILAPWKNLSERLENIRNTQTSFLLFLRLSLPQFKIIQESMEKELEGCFLLNKVQEEKGEVTCIFLGLKLYKETIDRIFKANSVIPVDFPILGREGTVSDAVLEIKLKIQEIERVRKELEHKKNSLAESRTKITLLYDHYYTIKNRLNTHNEFGHTEHTVIIKGWVKEYDTERLTQKLKTISDEIYVTFSDPDPSEEEVPIALKNKFMIKPFELIVRLYGMPNYMEKDPTPLIAVFFSLIFAFALADGIYGIVLAAIAYKILKKRDLDEQDTDVLWLLIWCGLSTLVVGAILGSWCGDIMDRLPSALSGITSAKNSLMLFDPLKDLKIFIAVSLSIGVIHVFTGLGFKAYQNILNGKVQDAFFDQVSWMILVSSVIGWGLAAGKIIPPDLGYYFSWGMKLGALLIILFGARDVKNIFSRVGMGLYKLYGASSYASDILSYIRLLALGLAGGIVGMVINIISGLLLKVPVVGIILAIALFSGFHLFSLAINVLGAFVHTCRLHYVEFFGKFYDNGGKAFIPFRKEGKFYIVKC